MTNFEWIKAKLYGYGGFATVSKEDLRALKLICDVFRYQLPILEEDLDSVVLECCLAFCDTVDELYEEFKK